MSLDHYPQQAYELAIELKESLTDAEISELQQSLTGVSIRDWEKWKMENEKLISEFVASTPSQRNKQKFKKLFPHIALAAYQHCMDGHVLLKKIESHYLLPGISYRSMASRAGEAYQAVVGSDETEEWPYEGECPFSLYT